MKNIRYLSARAILGCLLCAVAMAVSAQEPSIKIEPRHYICYRTAEPVTIDGRLSESAWQNVPWTEDFVDIEGSLKPLPPLRTRVKMLWDDRYLYVAAELEEPDIWATRKERDSRIYDDPDFEVFIDPDGDTHNYAEYEMNAFNTQWDLLLLKPYRDGAGRNVALDNWNFNGMKSAVLVDGTINHPGDTDKGWTVEIAFPLDALAELSATHKMPVDGEQYRVNFSRVEWTADVVDGRYQKRMAVVDGLQKPLPENNWVWSPQGVIAMHQPETWGYLQFSVRNAGSGKDAFRPNPDEVVCGMLRQLYFREGTWKKQHGAYSASLSDLGIIATAGSPVIRLTESMYEATCLSADGKRTWHIVQDGRIWVTPNP